MIKLYGWLALKEQSKLSVGDRYRATTLAQKFKNPKIWLSSLIEKNVFSKVYATKFFAFYNLSAGSCASISTISSLISKKSMVIPY